MLLTVLLALLEYKKFFLTSCGETRTKFGFSESLSSLGTVLKECFYARLCSNLINICQLSLIQNTICILIQHIVEHRVYWFTTNCFAWAWNKQLQKFKVSRWSLKCLWHEKYLLLIWKAFQNAEEWCFSFWNISFRFRDIDVFLLCKVDRWWRHIVCN